jgi:signal transduction histidine kinase
MMNTTSQTAAGPAASRDEAEIRQAIARAKLEWECTVDALDHLVCLLDASHRVVRVNRVVERWSLGSVNTALGKNVHTLLHGECDAECCELARRLHSAWRQLNVGEGSEFEFRDVTLGRALHISLRPMARKMSGEQTPDDTLAVLVVSDITALQLAQEALRTLNTGLESRVRARTRDLADANRDLQNEVIRREAAEKALRQSGSELALLSEQLMNAQELERKRIARELHDSVGQALSAIKYGLERADVLAQQGRLGDAQPVLGRAVTAVQATIEEIRSIAMNLRPSLLDDLGAASAVAWFCREFFESYPNILLSTRIELDDVDIPPRLCTAVFRSVQELLNNVARHAHARHSCVAIRREQQVLVLEVHDDGIGFDASDTVVSLRHGHGIRNLRERADMTGGRLMLSAPQVGPGTLARIEWRLGADEMKGERASCVEY